MRPVAGLKATLSEALQMQPILSSTHDELRVQRPLNNESIAWLPFPQASDHNGLQTPTQEKQPKESLRPWWPAKFGVFQPAGH